jgi:uncharacterized protein YjlB
LTSLQPETLRLQPDGGIPNSGLPVLIYRGIEIAREVLAIVAGNVRVRLGGPGGSSLEARRGDVLVLPAGPGHCNEGDISDLLVLGAYPNAMS